MHKSILYKGFSFVSSYRGTCIIFIRYNNDVHKLYLFLFVILLREVAKKRYFFSGPATKRGRGGECKGLVTNKNTFLKLFFILFPILNKKIFI